MLQKNWKVARAKSTNRNLPFDIPHNKQISIQSTLEFRYFQSYQGTWKVFFVCGEVRQRLISCLCLDGTVSRFRL